MSEENSPGQSLQQTIPRSIKLKENEEESQNWVCPLEVDNLTSLILAKLASTTLWRLCQALFILWPSLIFTLWPSKLTFFFSSKCLRSTNDIQQDVAAMLTIMISTLLFFLVFLRLSKSSPITPVTQPSSSSSSRMPMDLSPDFVPGTKVSKASKCLPHQEMALQGLPYGHLPTAANAKGSDTGIRAPYFPTPAIVHPTWMSFFLWPVRLWKSNYDRLTPQRLPDLMAFLDFCWNAVQLSWLRLSQEYSRLPSSLAQCHICSRRQPSLPSTSLATRVKQGITGRSHCCRSWVRSWRNLSPHTQVLEWT